MMNDLSRRDFVKLGGLGAAGLLAPSPDMTFPPGVVTTMTPSRFTAVTIDDGWNPLVTKVILENLRQALLHSTWFLVGQAIRTSFADNPELAYLQRELRRTNRHLIWSGQHEVAYHSMYHGPLEEYASWSPADWRVDYEQWLEVFHDVFPQERWHLRGTGSGSPELGNYARAPYGLFTDSFMMFCEDHDLIPVGWSNDLNEWRRGRIIAPGQIVLAHTRLADFDLIAKLTYWRRRGLPLSSLGFGLWDRQQMQTKTRQRVNLAR